MKKLQEGTLVYLSGPISGRDIVETRKLFDTYAEKLRAKGLCPVSPLDNGLPEGSHWREHMSKDLSMLFNCRAILMLPDWQQSAGARIEHCVARESRIKLLYVVDSKIYYNTLVEL